MEKKAGEILFLVAVLAAVAGLCVVLLPPGLSSNEEAVQYVQMKTFALNGSLEIPSPAFVFGFEATDMAGHRGFFEARNGRLYATPPPLFPWITSLFYPVFGERTVDFAPILFVFFSVLVLGLVLDRVMQRDHLYWLLLAAFLAGSPVFLQGLMFAGMSLALLLIVLAIGLLVSHFAGHPSGPRLLGASLLMGASALVSPDVMFTVLSFHLCAAVVLAVQRRKKDLGVLLAGFAVGLCAFVLHDIVLHGRFPGPYLKTVLPQYSLSPVRFAALGGSLSVSLALIALSRQEGIKPARKAILSVLSVILVIGAVLMSAARFSVPHLMAFFPAVLFAFYGIPEQLERMKRREGTLEAILRATIVVCLALGAAILRPGEWIVLTVWLATVPFVIVLLATERKRMFVSGGMYLVLAFFCGVAFVNGIQESKSRILEYREYNAARIAFLGKQTSQGDVILFSDTGSMEHAGPLFFDRVFLAVKNPGDPERFAGQLRGRGINRMYVWTSHRLGMRGLNPYGMDSPAAFPYPQGKGACCSGSCKERYFYLIRLDPRSLAPAGFGQGGL
jgi:hypothetical protein